jgi:hypothetical protein
MIFEELNKKTEVQLQKDKRELSHRNISWGPADVRPTTQEAAGGASASPLANPKAIIMHTTYTVIGRPPAADCASTSASC